MVYVDTLIDYGWKLGPSCHMFADSVEELNEFAVKIGMKLSWYQESSCGMPHYDLVKSRRDKAIKLGAKEIDKYDVYDMLTEFKSKLKN